MSVSAIYKDKLKSQIDIIPSEPGVYIYSDIQNEVIYIGKAKNLKKRVTSYFSKSNTGKTKILVSKIRDINYIVVESESDALLLENNLIKKYKPRYNILLKDDKTFPWICIKKEPFPRVFYTRNKLRDGSEYFGPYTSMVMVRTLMDLIRQLYTLRTCRLNLSKEKINAGKYKLCLEYHIGKCLGPCVKKQNEEDYLDSIKNVRSILRGNIHNVLGHLKKLMLEYSSDYKYEEAEYIKEKIEMIKNYQSKSMIVSPRISNIDVFSIVDSEKSAYVNFLRLINGAIVQSHSIEIKKKLDEKKSDLLSHAIIELREQFDSNAKETLIPIKLEYNLPGVRFVVPRKGEKKQLLDLSERNAKYFLLESGKRQLQYKEKSAQNVIMQDLKTDLRLKHLPIHMECFDNSNIQGKYPVASCVVFKNGRPSKKEYRHYNIKTVEGADDFSSMKEIVYRRYRRLLDENQSLPQAIIVDGGKGQLNAAVKSLEELNLRGQVPVFGIAKKLEEIFVPGDPIPLYLNKNSMSLKIIQQMRNEAHRFGITFHRQKRSNDFLNSEFDKIKGIGPKSMDKLLKKYKSVERLKKLSFDELKVELGDAKARILAQYFKNSSI
ncbi:MAG: excinuclease ABC subunit UvrC [Bacteroidales bacterium]|nr:excinuclease ABC subunit UvrC [Bacteroidales bacterium]